MQSKEKRKINPRRRLLMRLIFGIVAIAIVLIIGLRALKPTGAQIVYIAPDDNGYDAIWLADLNDLEHPRQLTFHEGLFIRNFQVSEENSIVFYHTFSNRASEQTDSWIVNLNSGQHQMLEVCTTCINFQLHPNGQWLTFEDIGYHSDEIYTYNLRTLETNLIFDFEKDLIYSHTPRWIGNTDRLVFRISDSNYDDEFAFYSIEEHRIIDTLTLDASEGMPHFSHNGISYEYHPESITRQLRNINNPDLALNLPYPVYDWHPNDEQLLMVDYAYDDWEIDGVASANVYLFNILNGEYNLLLSVENTYPHPTFNADGSLILYSGYTPDRSSRQFMLFDMETREEITLPIVGRDPQWVNGGRSYFSRIGRL